MLRMETRYCDGGIGTKKELQLKKVGVLFVCLGNICRSPTAQGVFCHVVKENGLEDRVTVASAGLGDWHAGDPPDRRASAEAKRRGVDLSAIRARQIRHRDFAEFDYILAMDRQNIIGLEALCPQEHLHKVRLFLEFAPDADVREVPDPYYGGPEGFVHVYDLVAQACEGLLEDIRQKHL